MAKLRITLVKSPIGYRRDQLGTVRALGLRKLHSTVEQEDNPTIRGMLHKISHLLEVNEE
ncbi:MAG: 50S ribosomal protein L30 [Chloroflexi bacterium]|nr:50S ribosomal protein L30 [Chloroflexota bacterium]